MVPSSSMSQAARLAHYTYEQYRRFEESTNARHEYLHGQILAMAGGTPEHAARNDDHRPPEQRLPVAHVSCPLDLASCAARGCHHPDDDHLWRSGAGS
jgi:hypothetical protein